MPNGRLNPFAGIALNLQQQEALRNLEAFQHNERVRPHPIDNNAFVIMDDIAEEKALPKYEIFWGGADVDPSFYNRERSAMCGRSDIDKDTRDRALMEERIKQGVPIIGICRGAQLLNVVNGGILVQHIDGHAIGREHWCTNVETGDIFSVSSTHHQMMIAHQDGQILFKDYGGADGIHWDNVNEKFFYNYVTEVVYYPATKSLCIQPHPEWMNQQSDFVRWINAFIKKEWDLDPINFAAEEAAFLRR